jgi:hypothetical protein
MKKSQKNARMARLVVALFMIGAGFSAPAAAQTETPAAASAPSASAPQADAKKTFETQARAVSATALLAGQTPVQLWGVEAVEAADPAIKLKARTALDNLIGGRKFHAN